MKKFMIILVCFVFFACNYEDEPVLYAFDYNDAKEAAISAWEEKMSWISDKCLQHIEDVYIIESDDIFNDCFQTTCNGCMLTDSGFVYVDVFHSDKDKLEIAVHEIIHHIETCEYSIDYYKDPRIEFSGRDGGHYNKKVWGCQKDSVENIGKKLVIEFSHEHAN